MHLERRCSVLRESGGLHESDVFLITHVFDYGYNILLSCPLVDYPYAEPGVDVCSGCYVVG